jgi:hypothetical protein
MMYCGAIYKREPCYYDEILVNAGSKCHVQDPTTCGPLKSDNADRIEEPTYNGGSFATFTPRMSFGISTIVGNLSNCGRNGTQRRYRTCTTKCAGDRVQRLSKKRLPRSLNPLLGKTGFCKSGHWQVCIRWPMQC